MWPFSKKKSYVSYQSTSILPKEVTFGRGCKWTPELIVGNVAQLYSKYICLPLQRYNNDDGETTWKDCSLRKWLNGECYQELFSTKEQSAIISTGQVNAIDVPVEPIPGYTLDDKIIIPTFAQIVPHFMLSDGMTGRWKEDSFAFLQREDSACCPGYWLRPSADVPSQFASIMDGDPGGAEMPYPEKGGALVVDDANECGRFYGDSIYEPSHILPLFMCPRVSEFREVRMIVHVDLSYLLSTNS